MEISVTPVEENPAPKLTGSIIQISSIYIDLKIPMEKNETESCQHNFSILGYAAEMRMKNPKASMPFAFDGTQLLTPDRSESITDVDINAPSSVNMVQDSPLSSGHLESNIAETGDVAAADGDTEQVGPVIDKAGDIRDEQTIAQIGNAISTGDNKGPDRGNKGDGNSEIPREFEQSAEGSSAEIDVEQRINPMPSESGDGAYENVEVAFMGTDSSIGVATPQAEECGIASFEGDQNKKHQNSSGVSRRKTRKLRFLTDLLGDKGNLRSVHPREDDSSIHSKLGASSGSGTLVFQGQAPCEDGGKGSKGPQRKRKMPLEEAQGITDLGIVGTNDSVSKAYSERTVTNVGFCSSEGQVNASSGVVLQIAHKNDRFKHKTDRTPSLLKRKNKQIQVHERFSPKPGEQSSSKNNIKEGDLGGATANTLFGFSETSSAAGKTDNNSRTCHSLQEPERENGDVKQTASQILKLQPSYLKVGLDLSLNSFTEKIDSSVNKEKATTSKSLLEKNDLHTGQRSILPPSEPDPSLKKSQVWDLNERIAQNSSNLLEKRNFSMLKEMDFLQPSQKEKTFEIQGRPKEIIDRSDEIAGNRIAQGSSDDIPMEIVELMAKNQYERGLPDSGSHSFRNRMNNTVRRFPEAQGMGPMKQLAKGFPGLTSFSPANTRSGLAIGGANPGAANGSSVNCSQMNRNHFEIGQTGKNKVSFFDMFSQNQQILSCGMPFPASASVRTGSQCNERLENLSPSTAPNMSFALGIQLKYPAQNPESQHKGKTISDIKAEELKKTQEAHSILSKPGGSELNCKPKGPLDPYANESIPAMQLLSLMDGRSPGNRFNMGASKPFAPCGYHPRFSTNERRDFLNSSLFLRQNQAKDLSRLGYRVGESSGRSSGRLSLSFSGQPEEQEQSQISRSTSCIPYTSQTSSREKDKQKATLGASDCIPYLQENRERRLVCLKGGSIAEMVRPLRSIPPDDYCATNRNPAEFTLPDAGNAFTICGKDLKFPKRKYSKANIGNGMKRQRVIKPKAGKEQPQNPSS